MIQLNIRSITGQERCDVMYRLATYAFRATPPLPDPIPMHEMIARRERTICLGVEENGEIVATAASAPFTQNVRGRILGMGGIYWVVTVPQARKKGYCKALMRQLLAEIRSEGRPVSCLYPFRESFYERMGYVTFPQMKKAVFAPSALLPVMNLPHRGLVELKLLSDCVDEFRGYLAELQSVTHGLAFFEDLVESPDALKSVWAATARVNGKICGAMLYQLKGEHPTEFTMHVSRFYTTTSDGRYLLLDWIARHTDQARTIEMTLPAYELPETWMSDLNVRLETFYTAPMGRVIDVAGLEGIDAGPGRIRFELSDPLCPWNDGYWQFTSEDGHLGVKHVKAADCRMDIRALSAIVYGTHDYCDLNTRGWADIPEDGIVELRNMFPHELPYLHAFF